MAVVAGRLECSGCVPYIKREGTIGTHYSIIRDWGSLNNALISLMGHAFPEPKCVQANPDHKLCLHIIYYVWGVEFKIVSCVM